MSQEDKTRWEKKYQAQFLPKGNVEIVEKYAHLAQGKVALDIACGMGRNSKVLAKMGFEVEALDISPTAIASLQNIEHITPKEVDFDSYRLKENQYDLVVCTYFLKRELFPQIIKAIKTGGVLIYETFTEDANNKFAKAPTKKNYLLKEGELERTFREDFEILHLESYWKERRYNDKILTSSLVARKY